MLKETASVGNTILGATCNSIIIKRYFPGQGQVAQIIMIPKQDKPPKEVNLYRPVNLLKIISRIFEKPILKKLFNIPEENRILQNHQFGFCQDYSTKWQVHRYIGVIREALEKETVFLCTVSGYHISV
jgi:hypothetical protein